MTVGEAVSILHLTISPPVDMRAASISAAVVPGAKLLPITVNGPSGAAIPLILTSPLGGAGFSLVRSTVVDV